jgi:hypothetical protein
LFLIYNPSAPGNQVFSLPASSANKAHADERGNSLILSEGYAKKIRKLKINRDRVPSRIVLEGNMDD